jgi:TPR repeat protein
MADERSEVTATRDPDATRSLGIELAGSDTASRETGLHAAGEADSRAGALILAQLQAEQKDGRGTMAAFQRAVRRGHVAPSFSLGDLLAESDDAASLVNAYRVAAECGDQGAAYQLGLLYLDRGDLESARSVFARADRLGHPWAALALGEILEQAGERGAALAAYERAADRRVVVAQVRLEALLIGRRGTEESLAATGLADAAGAHGSARRWTRRRLTRIAVSGALLAALLVVVLLTLSPAGRTRPAGPATRAAAGGAGSNAPPGGKLPLALRSPTAGFTAKQATLLGSVPAAARAECLPRAAEPLPRSDASISCFSASAGVTVLYYRYTSLPLLRSVFHNYRAWFAGRQKLRDCAGGDHGTYFQGGASSAITGRWACFSNDRTVPQSACIDWADYRLLIFGSACEGTGNFSALLRWWRDAGPAPRSAQPLTNRTGARAVAGGRGAHSRRQFRQATRQNPDSRRADDGCLSGSPLGPGPSVVARGIAELSLSRGDLGRSVAVRGDPVDDAKAVVV